MRQSKRIAPDGLEVGIATIASPAGVWDMSGNVWEWMCSWYDEDSRTRVVRGGSWIGYRWFAHTIFCNGPILLMFLTDSFSAC